MLTLTGGDTYFDYHGRGMGTQFLLCERFAQQLGVLLRVETCKDTAEMTHRLLAGEGDIIVFQMPRQTRGLRFCGYGEAEKRTSWAVSPSADELAKALDSWYKPELLTSVKKEEKFLFSPRSIRRRTYAPMLNASAGIISRYDDLFRRYAPTVRWDWRLMAAQCYQESTFDPEARSWAGARGLMQIMPSTADEVGLALKDIHDPEKNIAAAARYIMKLQRLFSDIPNPTERQWFVLASYNGGHFHIRDAMALTRKQGGNPYSWAEVSQNVLRLSSPAYYRDPVVRYGYMRGQETAEYVARIRDRWAKYRGVKTSSRAPFQIERDANGIHEKHSSSDYEPMSTPQKARRKNRFKI